MNLLKYFPDSKPLTFAESQIMNYLNLNISGISSLTIIKLANACNVSTATVIRLCHKLGFQTYSKFRYKVTRILEQATDLSHMTNWEQDLTINFQQTVAGNTAPKISEVRRIIMTDRPLYIFALGLTSACARYAELAFQQMGKSCSFIYDHQVIWAMDHVAAPHAIALFISNSGESEELVSLLQRIQGKNGLTSIALVNRTNSTLSALADISLTGHAQRITIDKTDYTPHFSLVLILDMLIQDCLNNISETTLPS